MLHAVTAVASVDGAATGAAVVTGVVTLGRHIPAEALALGAPLLAVPGDALLAVVVDLQALASNTTFLEVRDGDVATLFASASVDDLVRSVAGLGSSSTHDETEEELHREKREQGSEEGLWKAQESFLHSQQRGVLSPSTPPFCM